MVTCSAHHISSSISLKKMKPYNLTNFANPMYYLNGMCTASAMTVYDCLTV